MFLPASLSNQLVHSALIDLIKLKVRKSEDETSVFFFFPKLSTLIDEVETCNHNRQYVGKYFSLPQSD